jgi:ABC-type transport system substrate-binding protein
MKFKIGFALLVTAVLLWGKAPVKAPLPPKTGISVSVAIPYALDVEYDPVKGYINLLPLYNNIYGTLFKLDHQFKPYPFLVERYDRQGKTVVLYIRETARFSDGSPITAADAVASIEAAISSDVYPNPFYKVVEGGEDLLRGKTSHCRGLKVLGPKKFHVQLTHENVELGYYLSTSAMAVLPRDRKRKKMIYSGPFQVVKHHKGKRKTILTLEHNPWYQGKMNKIQTLSIHFYNRHTEFEMAIRHGIPDIFLYNRRFKMPLHKIDYNIFKTPTFGAFYFQLNPVKGPFQDKRLRTFFRNFILSWNFRRSHKWQLAAPTNLVLPYNLVGYFVFKPMEVDDFKALAPPGKVTVRCVASPTGIRTQIFPLLKKALKKYNLELDIKWDTLDNIRRLEKKGAVDLTGIYYLTDIPLSSYFYENLFIAGHELNLFGYQVPKARELLETYRRETDELKRLKILARLEEIAQEEAFLVPLANPLSVIGFKGHLKNVKIDKFSSINFEDIDVEKRN